MIPSQSIPGPVPTDLASASRIAPVEAQTLVIEASSRLEGLNIRELWMYRGLFLFLIWRDVKVRYAQTILGAGWAVLQPVLTMVVFAVIFGRFAHIPSDGVPYPVFSLIGLVPWTYFSMALTTSSSSLVASSNLITKIYFPRLIIPAAPVFAALVDFAIGLVIVVMVMAGYRIAPHPAGLLLLPVLVLVMVLTVTGVGCWLAALNIKYRDVKYVVPFLTQIWMYASPIVYPMSVVPERYRFWYALNPMAGVVEGFRSALLGHATVGTGVLATSLGIGVLVFISGTLYFRNSEHLFADVA